MPGAGVPQPRRFGAVNWRGVWSLVRRDILRFYRNIWESLAGPAVSSLLFLAVFELALGGGDLVPGMSLAQFVAPGIVVFSLTHSAFETAALPVIYDKLEGMIADVIGAPLTPLEITLGYALSATSSGLTTGAVIFGLMAVFIDLPVPSAPAALAFAAGAALLFALFGVIVGIWSDRWDNYAAAETFVMMPLGLLSGAFFAVEHLPPEARWAFEVNPIFHAVVGVRYGLTGYAPDSVAVAGIVLAVLSAGLGLTAWRLLSIGYKIKP